MTFQFMGWFFLSLFVSSVVAGAVLKANPRKSLLRKKTDQYGNFEPPALTLTSYLGLRQAYQINKLNWPLVRGCTSYDDERTR